MLFCKKFKFAVVNKVSKNIFDYLAFVCLAYLFILQLFSGIPKVLVALAHPAPLLPAVLAVIYDLVLHFYGVAYRSMA